jgi:hypothetical protein
MYLQNLQNTATPGMGKNGNPDNPGGHLPGQSTDEPFVAPAEGGPDGNIAGGNVAPARHGSILRQPGQPGRQRGESIAAMGRRVDFSLGKSYNPFYTLEAQRRSSRD